MSHCKEEAAHVADLPHETLQLSIRTGTAPLAPPAPPAPQCLLELLGRGRSWQQLEAVRLQLPAGIGFEDEVGQSAMGGRFEHD